MHLGYPIRLRFANTTMQPPHHSYMLCDWLMRSHVRWHHCKGGSLCCWSIMQITCLCLGFMGMKKKLFWDVFFWFFRGKWKSESYNWCQMIATPIWHPTINIFSHLAYFAILEGNSKIKSNRKVFSHHLPSFWGSVDVCCLSSQIWQKITEKMKIKHF